MYLKELKDYIIANGFSDAHVHHLKIYLNYCQKNNVDITKITFDDLTKYLVYLKGKDYAENTIANRIKAIKFYYKFLVLSNIVPQSIFEVLDKIKQPKIPHKIKDFLTEEEMWNLTANAMTYIRFIPPIKIKAIIYFLFYTGLRKQELLRLKRTDINTKEMKVIIRLPVKNKEEKYGYYPPKVAKILDAYFLTDPVENINAFNITQFQFEFFISRLNNFLPRGRKITPHTFRHSFGNLLVTNNINVRVAQKLMGHKNIHSTLVYYNPSEKIVESIYRDKIHGLKKWSNKNNNNEEQQTEEKKDEFTTDEQTAKNDFEASEGQS